MKVENVCGEIFRSNSGVYGFSCSYCTNIFSSSTDAIKHIETHFLSQISIKNKICELDSDAEDQILNLNKDENELSKEDCLQEETLQYEEEKTDSDLLTQVEEFDDRTQSKLELLEITAITDEIDYSSVVDHDDDDETDNSKENIIDESSISEIAVELSPTAVQQKKRSNPIVECDICQKKMTKCNMFNHLETHLTIKKYECNVCHRKYQTKRGLIIHMPMHVVPKRYNCEICGWLFHTKSNLTKHIRHHTDARPYKCKICDRTFRKSSYINVHIRTHTGERPFECPICGKCFASSNSLGQHKKRQHDKENNREKCDLCNCSFSKKSTLIEHRRSHTGERPFLCAICEKSFMRKRNYMRHIESHSGGKTLKCRYCDKCFVKLVDKELHEKIKHVNASIL